MLRKAQADVLLFDDMVVDDTVPQTVLVSQASQESMSASQGDKSGPGHVKKDKYAMPKVKCHVPNNTENNLLKARTFSFHQLYEFNNLCLNKSFLRKRVRASEEDIDKNQTDIAALFKWKAELTE